MMRYIAKNLVPQVSQTGLRSGELRHRRGAPTSVAVETFGTGVVEFDEAIVELIRTRL